MKTLIAIVTSFLLLLAHGVAMAACGTNSTTITNLPAIPGSFFQVNVLNAAGELTGYFSVAGDHDAHAFIYSGGTLTDLQTLGGTISQGFGINASGQVAGDSFIAGNAAIHGFFFNGSSNIDVGTMGGTFTSAVALNDAAQVIGYGDPTNGGLSQAFLFANGSITNLGTLGGAYSAPAAINNSGQVVGESSATNGDIHAFLYAAGPLTDLGTLGGNYSSAFAINEAGLIAGESSLTNGGPAHAFAYSAGTMTDIGTLGGSFSSASAVNNDSIVIGVASTPGDLARRAFVYNRGVLTDLGALGGSNSFPYAINGLGQVVGEAETGTGSTHAFLWSNGMMNDLNNSLSAGSGWELASARFINDAGRIVGFGTNDGVGQWFILDVTSGSNGPPVAIAGPDQTTDCPDPITLDGSQSFDPDGDRLTFEWTLNGTVLGTNSILTTTFPQGTNVVNLTVTDSCGLSSQTSVTIRVGGVVHTIEVVPGLLWPPNHKLIPVTVAVTDSSSCGAAPSVCRISSITASEPTARGDIQITGDLTAKLAAWRDPHRNGRVYVITVLCTDASGNVSTSTVTVTVPKHHGKSVGH